MDYDVSLQTISWFNERRETDTLQISPKFQRRAVWLEKERSELIETICSRLPFPEIYVHVTTDAGSGKQKYVIVDGQQRVTSILKFIDNDVELPSGSQWNGKKFSDLSETEQLAFWDYKIVVRTLRNTSDVEIRDLFQRLNTNNIALNDQELRNARYTGKFKKVSERLADNPLFQSIQLFTPREVRRMEDIEYVSELLLRIIAGVTNKKDILDDAYLNYNEEFPAEAQSEMEFSAVIGLVGQLIRPDYQTLVKTKSNFYSLFGACLEYYRLTKRTTFRRPDDIAVKLGQLLQDVRSKPANELNNETLEYYDAVSRAASDRARRAKRENILKNLLLQTDESK